MRLAREFRSGLQRQSNDSAQSVGLGTGLRDGSYLLL